MTFEENLKKLELIVRKMESGELKLDESLKAFEEGRALVESCRKELDAIRLKIEKVTADGRTEPFDFPVNKE